MKLTRKEVIQILGLLDIKPDTLTEVAVRGGVDGDDDRGVYDDYLHSITSTDFKVWKHNTNPSASYKRGLAELIPGLWTYIKGDHNITRPARRHPAFRQPDNMAFVVNRDGVGTDRGIFAINHHRGGVNGTSSLGCQTNSPGVWSDYLPWAYKALGDRPTKQYLLINESQASKILSGDYVPKLRRDNTLWLAEKGSVEQAPIIHVAPKMTWSIRSASLQTYPGEIKVIAGRPIVRTRLASRWIDSFDPKDIEKSLEWVDDELMLMGNRIDEVTVDANGDSWAPLREITNAVGATISINKNLITVTAKKH